MRINRALCAVLLAGALAVTGCGDTSQTGSDGGTPDLSVKVVQDLSMVASPDLSLADMTGTGLDATATVDLLANDAAPEGDLLIAEGDLATPPCGNTANSCGSPGMCIDCTNSMAGTACVNGACGCNSSTDCPIGNACDPASHLCSAKCAGAAGDGGATLLTCNGGCCDGANCVGGIANTACGNSGAACIACGGGTPTCAMGACTATCAPGGMGGAACGMGFCCNAMNTCASISNTSCALAGAACTDCTQNVAGPLCNLGAGTCGCLKATDCPIGEACDNGVCGAACDANDPCNGGCCEIAQGMASGSCSPGNESAQCATAAVCVNCSGNARGIACVQVNGATACGCASAADCPSGQACNLTTKVCGTGCDTNDPCNGGCCSAAMNGTCVGGTAQVTCGNNGGLCSNCMTQFQGMKSGQVCEAIIGGGQCGCAVNGDCPANSTGCNTMTKLCNFNCSANAPCLSGCCSIAQGQVIGTCSPGTVNTACGATMLCSDCTAAANGHLCIPATSKCGCAAATDCAAGTACNTMTHVCEDLCGDANHTACNGGCCNAMKCVGGGDNNACGAKGTACRDCTTVNAGHVCENGVSCGCNVAADCPADTACNTTTHLCEAACGDAAHTACNTGCCSIPMGQTAGTCVAGTGNTACGNDGNTCATCANGTPTCTMNACAADCGKVGNGTCGGGFCCNAAANKCTAGTASNTCGYSGTCSDCTANTNGHICESKRNPNGPWYCGCEQEGDCPAANPANGSGGYACDVTANNCTTTCGVNGVTTLCNGGCCQFANGSGVCRPGTIDTTCGASGGLCSNCTVNCATVATCTNGSCGCCAAPNTVCNNNAQCCSGSCTNGRCTCIVAGGACDGNAAVCCVGRANQAQTCGGNNTCCLAATSFCAANADCCSNSCLNARCQ